MKPGKDLDIFIAEHVMGWGPRELGPNIATKWKNPKTSDGYTDETLPEFSEDIAAAWQVVEEIKDIEPMHEFSIEYVEGKWKVDFVYLDYDYYNEGDIAITAPHAICLAALKAKRVKV